MKRVYDAIYTLDFNLDRNDKSPVFREGDPQIGAIIKIEEEYLWHYPIGVYSRGVGDTDQDRHFEGHTATVIGYAIPEIEYNKIGKPE